MRALSEIAELLRAEMRSSHVTQLELGAKAGVARRTLTGVLSGRADYKVTTLMAVLDRLGFELAIVPKQAASGLLDNASFRPAEPSVASRVQRARARLTGTGTGTKKSSP